MSFLNIFKRKKKVEKEKTPLGIKSKEAAEELKKIQKESPLAIIKSRLIRREAEEITSQDIRKVLKIMDRLLGDLPKEEIEEFAMSKDFELYKKVLSKFVPEVEHEEKLKKKVKDGKLTKEQIEKIDTRLRESIKKHKEKKIG